MWSSRRTLDTVSNRARTESATLTAHDFENFRYVTYRTNGVHAYCLEKAGAPYLFRNGRFIRIVDSD